VYAPHRPGQSAADTVIARPFVLRGLWSARAKKRQAPLGCLPFLYLETIGIFESEIPDKVDVRDSRKYGVFGADIEQRQVDRHALAEKAHTVGNQRRVDAGHEPVLGHQRQAPTNPVLTAKNDGRIVSDVVIVIPEADPSRD